MKSLNSGSGHHSKVFLKRVNFIYRTLTIEFQRGPYANILKKNLLLCDSGFISREDQSDVVD
jgi:hypothetical protein